MAGYTTAVQPQLVMGAIGGGPRIWVYVSTDADTVVRVSGYITDGYSLGMRDGDILWHYLGSTTKVWYSYTVTVSGTTVDLSNSTAMTTTTNSD